MTKLVCPALLALEDGTLFEGSAFGHLSHSTMYSVGEVVFNTSMTGYQEILTDPSYANQLITLTYPHIGNVGINLEDRESNNIFARGLIIRELPIQTSNWRQQATLQEFMAQHKIFGITGIDTRMLTKIIRVKGAQAGCLVSCAAITDDIKQQAISKARQFPGLKSQDLASKVTTSDSYIWQEGGSWLTKQAVKTTKSTNPFNVVVYDFGVKKNILRILDDLNCQLTIVPASCSAQEVLQLNPDGIFLSNGPGDPDAVDYVLPHIRTFLDNNIPLFGICLGHQLLALSLGAKTCKMKFGHHGGNHPVRCLDTNTVSITSQNHGFVVDEANLPPAIKITHRSLFDNTIQGISHISKPAFGFQGHPEAGPGPSDARDIFKIFLQNMQAYRSQQLAAMKTERA